MTVTVADVRKAAGIYYGLSKDDLRGPERRRSHARPRQVAMALSRAMTNQSLPEIGGKFGRDHTTVLHAIAWTTARAAICPETDADMNAVALISVRCSIDRQKREREWVRRGLAAGEIVVRVEE